MARDYHHAVLPVSCVDLDAAALGDILRQVLYEFPVRELDLALPRWVDRAGERPLAAGTGVHRCDAAGREQSPA